MIQALQIRCLVVIAASIWPGGGHDARADDAVLSELVLPAVPGELSMVNTALAVEIDEDGSLVLTAPERTNLFNSPDGRLRLHSAPMVLFRPDAEFTMTVRVAAELKSVYDVAALVLYDDAEVWAKLCFENSVHKQPTIVSVVTRQVSDDCNSAPVAAAHVWLAIVRRGSEFAFHSSPDGRRWDLVRHFQLTTSDGLRVGFAAHGSGQTSLRATFSEITYVPLAKGMRQIPAP